MPYECSCIETSFEEWFRVLIHRGIGLFSLNFVLIHRGIGLFSLNFVLIHRGIGLFSLKKIDVAANQ
jgi:hypothetical protein